MKVLVTGGAGFIGCHLVEALYKEGHDLVVVERNFTEEKRKDLPKSFGIKLIPGDIAESDTWNNLERVDAVVALACFPRAVSLKDPLRDLEVNYKATVLALEYARNCDSSFVFTSNAGISGSSFNRDRETFDDPKTPYDVHKLASENLMKIYARQYHVRTLACRLASVYGPGQKCHPEVPWHPLIPHFFSLMHNNKAPIIDGDGRQTRDFIFVQDVVTGLVAAVHALAGSKRETDTLIGKTVTLATNEAMTLNAVYKLIAQHLEFRGKAIHGPRKAADIREMKYSNTVAAQLLHWKPQVSFEEGLSLTIEWLKKSQAEQSCI